MNIRHADITDLDILADIESASYPAAEGASRESIKARIEHFPDCFWILENDNGEILSFINGMLTDRADLTDEMYDDPSMHNKDGKWLMIFSVVAHPEQRSSGYASTVMQKVIDDMTAQCKAGIVLTCKEKLLGFYSRFGFENEGISVSKHGDALWYQMRLRVQ